MSSAGGPQQSEPTRGPEDGGAGRADAGGPGVAGPVVDDADGDGARRGDLDGDGAVDDGRQKRRLSLATTLLLVLLTAVVVGVAGAGLGWKLAQPTPVARDGADAGYLQDMLLVLDQSAQVATEYAARATNPEVAALAREEAAFSLRLIGEHEARLADLGYTRADRPALSRAWMSNDLACVVQPGIASEVDLTHWRRAAGPEADGRYLSILIPLKQQSVPMADVAARAATRQPVRDLAGRMARDQARSAQDLTTARTRLGLANYSGT